MREIENALLRTWAQAPSLNPVRYIPRNIDIECHNAGCGRSLVNMVLAWNAVLDFMWSSCTCANCRQVTRFFLFNVPSNNQPESTGAARVFQFPKPIFQGPFEPGVADVSTSFVEIHSQAQEAEAVGLKTLVGIGYRKALEFLIKDYLISRSPDKEDAIKKATLSQCIANWVDEPRMKNCAERAAWLGNDETHYVRIWPDKDLKDMKILIKLTQYWISSDVLTRQYSDSMVKK